jgi:hypothetical protein
MLLLFEKLTQDSIKFLLKQAQLDLYIYSNRKVVEKLILVRLHGFKKGF